MAHVLPPYYWGYEDVPPLNHGSAGAVSQADSPGQWCGTIYLPDPSERRGWRQFYVYRPESAKPPKPMGFRR